MMSGILKKSSHTHWRLISHLLTSNSVTFYVHVIRGETANIWDTKLAKNRFVVKMEFFLFCENSA